MNLCFDELKCPNCGTQTMSAAGGSFGGRITVSKKKCTHCELTLMIIPMDKKFEYNISATTEEERKEERIKEAIKESDKELAETIARIREKGY